MPNALYALMLAGGSGERFWPLSRRVRPKQLLRLVAKETLLEQAVGRLERLVGPERLLILRNVEQVASAREMLTQAPRYATVPQPAAAATKRRSQSWRNRSCEKGMFAGRPACLAGPCYQF